MQVSNKISREEVERMLRKVQQGMPQAHAPASGTRLKCIRCGGARPAAVGLHKQLSRT